MNSTATNEKGQDARDACPPDTTTNSTHSAALPAVEQPNQYGTDDDHSRKELARLQARFALKGYTLDVLADGGLLLHRWGLTRYIATLPEAEMWLLQIGGAA